ncbi:Gfo/Idh/MocA family protein [Herbiconiux sp. P17]|uniref:Gfo/Idh/MocA family protein n=1 Tax=Herbiconiux wuyangfengii TaxID=3342794 RepID=UPI0035BB57FD
MTDESAIRFGVIGSGWRSEFFLRIAAALPERFAITGLVTRNPDTARAVEERWGVATHPDLDALLDAPDRPEFVVVSVPREVAPGLIERLVDLRMPVLTETPPAFDLEALTALYERVGRRGIVQVAEQYHLSPLLNAQLAIARSGRIGRVSQALVAQCHDYHGISVLRRALGIGADDATITASLFRSPLLAGPDRHGDPREQSLVTAVQTSARFDFGDRLGLYDFAPEQYFSWIRGNRLLVRGERGEIENLEVRSVPVHDDFPVFSRIRRVMTGEGGNLEGLFLRGLLLGDEWVFRNPFRPGRLSDDEIAIALMLAGMRERITGGPEVYSLAEASQDHYLHLLMAQAAESGEPVRSTRQIWADDIEVGADTQG